LFTQTRFAAAIVAQLVIVFANTGALFFLPIFLRQVGGFSPLQAGTAMLPESIAGLLTATYTARMIGRWGHRRALLSGLAAGAAGLILLGLVMSMPYAAMDFPLILLGFSFGAVVTVASDLVLTSASADRVGAATGISEASFELGNALGIALIGSLVSVLYFLSTGSQANLTEAVDPGGFTAAMTGTSVICGLLVAVTTIVAARAVRGEEAPDALRAPPA